MMHFPAPSAPLLAVQESGERAACRVMGVHHSTSCRWKKQVERFGLGILRLSERRRQKRA
jgi:transposase